MLYNEVKALLIKYGADQKSIDSLDTRTEWELRQIRSAYISEIPQHPNKKKVAKDKINTTIQQ